jgi:hypothetical protein
VRDFIVRVVLTVTADENRRLSFDLLLFRLPFFERARDTRAFSPLLTFIILPSSTSISR